MSFISRFKEQLRELLRKLYDLYKELTEQPSEHYEQPFTMEFLLSLVFHYFYFSERVNCEVRLCDTVKEEQAIFKYRNHTNYGFTLQNFSFELLLKRISPNNILRIVCALLLEQKVILLFQNYQQNAVIMESLISLLTPLYSLLLNLSKWNFINISYMTPELTKSLDAPFPYFVGIPPNTWKQVVVV